jgi:hypothetical protein
LKPPALHSVQQRARVGLLASGVGMGETRARVTVSHRGESRRGTCVGCG